MGVFVEMHGTVHLWHPHFPICLSDFYILKINSSWLCLRCDFSPFLLCCCSVPRSCPTLRNPMDQASLSLTISWNLLWLMSIESGMPSNHLILCHLLLLPSIFPSIGAFWMSQLFASGGQSTGSSASASVLLCYLSVGNNHMSQFFLKFLLMLLNPYGKQSLSSGFFQNNWMGNWERWAFLLLKYFGEWMRLFQQITKLIRDFETSRPVALSCPSAGLWAQPGGWRGCRAGRRNQKMSCQTSPAPHLHLLPILHIWTS